MKRLFALFLLLALLLSSCSSSLASESTSEESVEPSLTEATTEKSKKYDKTGFQTGFAMVDITPSTGVPLAGYGNVTYRRSQTVRDPLYSTCVAMSDGENTLLFITNDLIRCSDELISLVQKRMQKAYGIPPENIIIAGTHTHSAPDIGADTDSAVAAYLALLYKGVVEACKLAIADLDRTDTYFGKTATEGLAHVRRYFRSDGTFEKNVEGMQSSAPIATHESMADQTMQIIKFDRANQKDIVLVNWRGHPTLTGGYAKTVVSADYVGELRRRAEADLDVNFAYYLDGSGNIQPHSRLAGEKDYTVEAIGKELNEVLCAAMPNLREAKTGKVSAVSTVYPAKVNKELGELNVEQLSEILQVWRSNQKDLAYALCRQYGVTSPYAASSFLSRSKLSDTIGLGLWAFSIGDIAMVSAPFEMFDTTSVQIREGSPFEITFVASCANGSNGYIPSAQAFPNGGYEVDTCKFVPGTAEELVAEYVRMLNTLKG